MPPVPFFWPTPVPQIPVMMYAREEVVVNIKQMPPTRDMFDISLIFLTPLRVETCDGLTACFIIVGPAEPFLKSSDR